MPISSFDFVKPSMLRSTVPYASAYHDPFAMAEWDRRFFDDGGASPPADRDAVEAAYVGYMERLAAAGEPWTHASRHMLGLRNATPEAPRWVMFT